MLQGGRSSRQSEGGVPGIQIFVKPRRKSAQPAQAPRLAATGSRQDAPGPPSRQSSGRLQSAALVQPHSRGTATANATSAQGGPGSHADQQASLGGRASDITPPLLLVPAPQHLLQPPATAQQPPAAGGFTPLSMSATGAPAMLSEGYLASLRHTPASSADADSMDSGVLNRMLSSSSGQLPPEQPGRQQSAAGVPEFRAAVAAEAATATAALAAQVRAVH